MSTNELTRAQAVLAKEISLLVRESVNPEMERLVPAEELAALVPLEVKWELDARVNPFTALESLEKALVKLKEELPTHEENEFLEEQILALASDALMGDL